MFKGSILFSLVALVIHYLCYGLLGGVYGVPHAIFSKLGFLDLMI